MNRVPQHAEPPFAVRVVVAALMVNAVTAIVVGWELLQADQLAFGLAHGLIALALLGRAFAIWRLRRRAYWMTVALVTLHVGITAVPLVTAAIFLTTSVTILLLAVGTLAYLLQPRVRECFI
jgi:hypothetical protein